MSTSSVCVYPGVCSDKHPVVAVVSAEVWEKDGSFLRYHSESSVWILGFPERPEVAAVPL